MKRHTNFIFKEFNIFHPKSCLHRFYYLSIIVIGGLILNSCEDFVEIEPPSSQLSSELVFSDIHTARAAMNGIYSQMRDDRILGYLGSRLGCYSDELDYFGAVSSDSESFHKNNFIPSDGAVSTLWNQSYYQIYCANDIIERIGKSTDISDKDKNQLVGEALFVRGLLHFYLTQLYGDIPYATVTNYEINTKITKISVARVLNKIEEDLIRSSTLLSDSYIKNDRTIPNKAVIMAMLARVYLYNQKWNLAHEAASYVINQQNLFIWKTDLQSIFLKDSKTTIWQWSTKIEGDETTETSSYVFESGPPLAFALTSTLINSFKTNDLRLSAWTRMVPDIENNWYHPFKYKQDRREEISKEFKVVFRLAEQYLIRSEARAHLNNLKGADFDLNKVRERAGLTPIESSNKETLIAQISQERRHELFTEFGHRFFDLKRLGQLDKELSNKPGWDSTDKLLPLPENELLINPNIEPQNPGY